MLECTLGKKVRDAFKGSLRARTSERHRRDLFCVFTTVVNDYTMFVIKTLMGCVLHYKSALTRGCTAAAFNQTEGDFLLCIKLATNVL